MVAKRQPCRQLATNCNTHWVRFRDCWEDRSTSQDVKKKGRIGVSSLVQWLRHCLIVWMNGAPYEASARIFARQMCTLLIHLCEGRALAIVRGAPDHNGLEAWRLLHEWYQPKTRSRGFALLNEIFGWDFVTKEQFLQRMKDWENATLEYNRTASAPLQEEVLVAVLISRSPKEVQTYLHVQVREETARLRHVRQLLFDYLRAGKAWKAPRTEEFAETNHSNVVSMDVDSLHCKGGKGKKGKGKGKNKR